MACPFPFLDSFIDYRKSNKKGLILYTGMIK